MARPVPSEVEGPEPIDEVALFADVTPPRARSIDEASYAIPVQSGSRALLVAGVVAVSVASFATGFGGGFIVGQRSGPAIESRLATESRDVSHHEPVADASTRAPCSRGSKANRFANAAGCSNSGRLLVRSTPSGAGVLVDGQESSRARPYRVQRIRLRSRTRVTARGSSGSR